jgi:hypothetical protein
MSYVVSWYCVKLYLLTGGSSRLRMKNGSSGMCGGSITRTGSKGGVEKGGDRLVHGNFFPFFVFIEQGPKAPVLLNKFQSRGASLVTKVCLFVRGDCSS